MPLDPSTPLRLVAGDDESLWQRIFSAINGTPTMSPTTYELASAVRAALFPPLEPNEEPMTVRHVNEAKDAAKDRAYRALWNGAADAVLDEAHDRIEQEVRRATQE